MKRFHQDVQIVAAMFVRMWFGFMNLCQNTGTSAIVYPAAELPIVAKNAGAYVMEINIEKTLISTQIDITILGKTGIVLPRLTELIMVKEGK